MYMYRQICVMETLLLIEWSYAICIVIIFGSIYRCVYRCVATFVSRAVLQPRGGHYSGQAKVILVLKGSGCWITTG